MLTTAAAANKLVKQLQDELDFMYQRQAKERTYTEVAGQVPIVPEYNFESTQTAIAALELKIRTIKHAVNAHNVTTVLPNWHGITIDQALIMLAQYNKRLTVLNQMRSIQRKTLDNNIYGGSNIVQYTVANFNPDNAASEYASLYTTIQSLQMAVDVSNTTETFEIEGIGM